MNRIHTLIQDALLDTGHVQHCAFIRKRDYAIQANSPGFHLHLGQIQTLMDAFRNSSSTREHGLNFQDVQYTCVRADMSSIYAKCGKKGLIMARSNKLVILATYDETMYASVCVEAVEKLADYLRDKDK